MIAFTSESWLLSPVYEINPFKLHGKHVLSSTIVVDIFVGQAVGVSFIVTYTGGHVQWIVLVSFFLFCNCLDRKGRLILIITHLWGSGDCLGGFGIAHGGTLCTECGHHHTRVAKQKSGTTTLSTYSPVARDLGDTWGDAFA